MEQQIKRTRKFKAGYHVHHGRQRFAGVDPVTGKKDEWTPMRWATTPEGDYIGTSRWAFRLCKTRGIVPELASPDHNVCSIGFCEREQKWYGWSHRAIYGFGVGDVVSEGDLTATTGWTDEYLAEHPEEDASLPVGFRAKTLDDAKRMAVAFAESVS